MPDDLKKFWQNNLIEIRENKLRFAALLILLVFVTILALSNSESGEEIILTEQPQIETAEEFVPVPNANIIVALGANSGDLYISNPFKAEPEIEPPPAEILPQIPEIPSQPEIIISQPVAQESPKPAEKFILRGTAIIGENKSALIQKNSSEDNLIVNIGDTLSGKIIVDIAQDSLIFDDGSKMTLNLDDQ